MRRNPRKADTSLSFVLAIDPSAGDDAYAPTLAVQSRSGRSLNSRRFHRSWCERDKARGQGFDALPALTAPGEPACFTSAPRWSGTFTPVIALSGRRDTSFNKLLSTALAWSRFAIVLVSCGSLASRNCVAREIATRESPNRPRTESSVASVAGVT